MNDRCGLATRCAPALRPHSADGPDRRAANARLTRSRSRIADGGSRRLTFCPTARLDGDAVAAEGVAVTSRSSRKPSRSSDSTSPIRTTAKAGAYGKLPRRPKSHECAGSGFRAPRPELSRLKALNPIGGPRVTKLGPLVKEHGMRPLCASFVRFLIL